MQHALRCQFDLYRVTLAQFEAPDNRGLNASCPATATENPGTTPLATCTARTRQRAIDFNGCM
jgi:hypothetical protein